VPRPWRYSCALLLATLDVTGVSGALEISTLHYVMLLAVCAFALGHSGLALLRLAVADIVGERLWRVIIALMCVLRAVLVDAYFIAHHYGGRDLWRLQNVPDAHEMRFALTLFCFQPL
jgi:hypothetical protein